MEFFENHSNVPVVDSSKFELDLIYQQQSYTAIQKDCVYLVPISTQHFYIFSRGKSFSISPDSLISIFLRINLVIISCLNIWLPKCRKQ